jgi:hypothetical protein
VIIYRHESFPFAVAKLVQGYEEWRGSTSLRFPEDIFGPEQARHWMRHIMQHLKSDQKRPFVLAADDGRRHSLPNHELKLSRCSWIVFHSGWLARKDDYEWAWGVLKAWPEIIEKCSAAYELNQLCKLSVSIGGKVFRENL